MTIVDQYFMLLKKSFIIYKSSNRLNSSFYNLNPRRDLNAISKAQVYHKDLKVPASLSPV
ncbi:hypothetical protein AGMMS49936_09400 [Endomicrobiia bacterium]|nr:hypothetical protein AGMMS49936_09400 [Endomicrobiia bacterium]